MNTKDAPGGGAETCHVCKSGYIYEHSMKRCGCTNKDVPDVEEWKVEVRDWWYRVQDDCGGMMHSLPEFRRVEIETIIKQALTEKDAEVEKALEAKAIEVREEEANEYNKIIEKEAEKARASLHASLVAAVEGKREPLPAETMTAREAKGYNQALDDTLTVINSIFKE